MRGRFFSGYLVIDLTDGLPPHLRHRDQIGRPWGLRDSTLCFTHDHLVPVSPGTITRSSPTWGKVERTPEAAGIPLLLEEAGSLLWRGVDDFPPCLGAVVILPWPEVDGCPPWFKVDPCLLPLGVDWVPSGRFPEAPIDGVSVWAGLSGRGLPLGWASGVLGIGCLWRWGMRWTRPCWATLQW